MSTKATLSITILMLFMSMKSENRDTMTTKALKIRENKVEINYYQQGKGDKTLLFLHGWCINSTYWENQITHFSEDYNVFAMDLPGFGKSTAIRKNWTIEEYAEDVLGFMDALDLSNVILIGHSMSGEIMTQAALSNSSRIIGLVGIDNFKHIDVEFTPEQMEQMGGMFKMLENNYQDAVKMYADLMLFHESTPNEIKEKIKYDLTMSDPNIGYNSLMNLMQFSQNTPSLLEALNKKLYLINSDATPTNEAGLQNRCKNGYEVKHIHATGHYPMLEKPDDFNVLLKEVLQELD